MKRNSNLYYVLANGKVLGTFNSFVCAVIFAEAYVDKCFVRDVDIHHGLTYVCSYKLK